MSLSTRGYILAIAAVAALLAGLYGPFFTDCGRFPAGQGELLNWWLGWSRCGGAR